MKIRAMTTFILVIKPHLLVAWSQKAAAASDSMQGSPAGQRASVGDVFDPTAVRNQTLLGHHVIKVTGIEFGESILLGNVDLKVRGKTFISSSFK